MKRITAIIALMFIIASCGNDGLTEKEKASMDLTIKLHRINYITENKLEAIDHVTNMSVQKIIQTGWKADSEEFKAYSDSLEREVMKRTFNNEPYAVYRDTTLTIDSYLAYCDSMKIDPKRQILIFESMAEERRSKRK